MDEETKKILIDHEERLKKLEGGNQSTPAKSSKREENYSGLSGGIRLIIKQGFLNLPKSAREIFNELKSKDYHYSYESADKLLRIDFVGNKILNRFKEGKVYKYVVRK